ncbi:PH domain-containing protein [Acanthopleuribacter pedis]|uniref:PH domain-containing protein n=1 Tax=Acanthopleuribacter pedis TaxID=442870 RepID=A0A8J7QRU7_9BACT|nr:PH domain-containing protein [Acanthopleuribacter pedis]MBO1323003.1 PH domain-containing protein [Acanthopleuribacter pedis]
MFKKLASEALGLSDIGKVVPPSDYDKVESDDFILKEDGEKIYFLIKSKADEYCFTNLSLLHLDGDSALSKKRALKRYSFHDYTIAKVWLETAGTVDLDVELKFSIGGEHFSIDIIKSQIDQVKDLYKALYRIASIQETNRDMHAFAEESLNTTLGTVKSGFGDSLKIETVSALNEYAFAWKKKAYTEYKRKDFGDVFEKYINN